MMLEVSGLYIYPVKSLGGISLSETYITDRGFQYDRRWMLVDESGLFLSQRTFPVMALIQCSIENEQLIISHKHNPDQKLIIPVNEYAEENIDVQIWDDVCASKAVNKEADTWFSEILQTNCRLVFMPDNSKREVEKKYALHNEITSFSDGYPILIIGQASLDDLNSRLDIPIPMNRFRPNIVFTGGDAFEEDRIGTFSIGDIEFSAVKPCARCAIPTINQDTAQSSKEPTRTLAKYRAANKKIYFGQNLLYDKTGKISVGEEIVRTEKIYQAVIS